jgi:4'-phosphopantetheinyl transferase
MYPQYLSMPKLLANAVHIWCARLDVQGPSYTRNLESMLSEDEMQRVESISDQSGKSQFIVCRGLLRKILASYLDIHPNKVEFSYNANGKPSLAWSAQSGFTYDKYKGGEIQFNLAHSRGLAIYAIALNSEIGVDLEYVRPIKEMKHFADRFFSRDESILLSKLKGKRKRDAFFKLWTCKEAYLKARGEGLAGLGSVNSIDFSVVLRKKRGILTTKEKHVKSVWSFCQFVPSSGFVATVIREGSSTDGTLFVNWIKQMKML